MSLLNYLFGGSGNRFLVVSTFYCYLIFVVNGLSAVLVLVISALT